MVAPLNRTYVRNLIKCRHKQPQWIFFPNPRTPFPYLDLTLVVIVLMKRDQYEYIHPDRWDQILGIMADTRPNILWLSLESVRADHTSLYGYTRDTTPFLRELSNRRDATILDPMIAASNWTPASTASMLTGTHLSTHQVGQDGTANHSLPSEIKTPTAITLEKGISNGIVHPKSVY